MGLLSTLSADEWDGSTTNMTITGMRRRGQFPGGYFFRSPTKHACLVCFVKPFLMGKSIDSTVISAFHSQIVEHWGGRGGRRLFSHAQVLLEEGRVFFLRK